MTPLPPKQGLKLTILRGGNVAEQKVMTPLPPKQGLKQRLRRWKEKEVVQL